jgi:heme O synthase-like polyprenyltransferase
MNSAAPEIMKNESRVQDFIALLKPRVMSLVRRCTPS